MATTIDNLQIEINAKAQSANVAIDQLVVKLNKLSTALSGFSKININGATQSIQKFGNTTKNISSGLNRASKNATKAQKSFGGLASAIGKFYASYFLVVRGIKALGKSIQSTADYVEAFNYYTVAFGKIASKWDENWENYGDENARNYTNSFVTTMNETFKKLSGVSYEPQTGLLSTNGMKNLGLNLQEVTQYAAQLASMMDAVGQSGETTLATTNAFVKLAGDISSLYNIDYQQAADKIRSVLQGQSRAGYGFGWDTTMAALQTTADKFDLSKPVSEMEQYEKQQLRILTILDQSRVAWGDQSNTINTLANQIRVLKNNLSEAGMILGQLFVPILAKMMPIINGITIAIKNLLSSLAVLFGIKIEDIGQGFSSMDDEIDGVADSFDEATASAKKFKSITLGIDELNINAPQVESGKGNGVGAGIDLTEEIIKATEEYEKVWQEAYDRMENRAQEFADSIQETFAFFATPLKEGFDKTFESDVVIETVTNVKELKEVLDKIFDSETAKAFSDAISSIVEGLGALVGAKEYTELLILSEAISGVKDALETSSDFIKDRFISISDDLSDFGDSLSDVADAFKDVGQAFKSSSFSEIVEKVTTIGAFVYLGELEIAIGLFTDLFDLFSSPFVENAEAVTEVLENLFEIISNLLTPFSELSEIGMGNFIGYENSGVHEFFELLSGENVTTAKLALEGLNSVLEKTEEITEDFNLENIKNGLAGIGDWAIGLGNSFQTNFVDPIVSKVTPIVEAFYALKTSIATIFDGLWLIIQAIWITASEWFNENVVIPVYEVFSPIVENISGFFTVLWENIKETWYEASTWFEENVATPFSETFSKICEKIGGFFEDLWTNIKDSAVKTMIDAVTTVVNAMNAIIGVMEGVINGVIDGINGLVSGFDSIVKWAADVLGKDWSGLEILTHVTLGRIEIPAYKTGGFPKEDGLFYANHNELVGEFTNGRTAVANNEMIVEGIEGGVERAVARVLAPYLADIAQNTRETADKDLNVNIGDRDIARANARGSRSLGYALVT